MARKSSALWFDAARTHNVGATTLFVGFSHPTEDDFIPVQELRFASRRDAWAYALDDDGGAFAALSVTVEALSRHIDIPEGYYPFCVCETHGKHEFCLWLYVTE